MKKNKSYNIPLYKQIYNDIVNKIYNGVLVEGTRLESVRNYAKKLNISTTTIEKAYNQLAIEGYIESRARSGFYVLKVDNVEYQNLHHIEPIDFDYYTNVNMTDDLFDFKAYKTIINRVINYQSDDLLALFDPRGEHVLREEIRKHVLVERDIQCDVNQIVIGPGIQNLLHILLSILKRKSICFIDPPFDKAITVFKSHEYLINSLNSVDELFESRSDFMYLSPSNTYPYGEVIKIKERLRLIKQAELNDSFIIEDDYNFFIRYNSFIVPSIYSLSNSDRVIYLGSFSKHLSHSHRISYMILPKPVYDIYKEVYDKFSQGVSKLDQLVLAEFMKEGLFKRHTKKLYSIYKHKNELVLKAMEKYTSSDIDYSGVESNLNVIIRFKDNESKEKFILKCEILHLKTYSINNLNLILPYAGIKDELIEDTIKRLFT